jgi:hypothetical protein
MNAWRVTFLRDRYAFTERWRQENIVVLARSAEAVGECMGARRPDAVVLRIENMQIDGELWDPVRKPEVES